MRLAVGELAGALTTGQRVVPSKLLELGYEFKYPKLEGALRELLGADQ